MKILKNPTFRAIVVACAGLLWASILPVAQAAKLERSLVQPAYAPGQVIIAFRPGDTAATMAASNARLVSKGRTLGTTRSGVAFARYHLPAGTDVESAVTELSRDPAVLAVSPNYINYLDLTPNDTSFGQMWGLHNTGQTISGASYTTNNPGNIDADIDAPAAWDVMLTSPGTSAVSVGTPTTIVAVIDTGVDYTHPELVGAMWDGGVTYPNHGYDFVDGDNDPYPLNSAHGTHVAGTIAASGNNSAGVPGVAYGVKIMALKVFSDQGGGASDADIIDAINFAASHGAHVINMSLGRTGTEAAAMTVAIQNAISAGVVVVAAAGNGGSDQVGDNNDTTPHWPSSYAGVSGTRNGTISVAATDQSDQRAEFSNFGQSSVSVGAPGVNILSTISGRATFQFETLGNVASGTLTSCLSNVSTCMNNTIFDNGATDCTGTCRWGIDKPASGTPWFFGDNTVVSGYTPNLNGTITSQAVNVAGAQRVALRYAAGWDLECNGDYVDVEVWDGGAWRLLHTTEQNVNNAMTGYCTPNTHTHTGRTYPIFGVIEVSHDITAFANAALQVRFHYVTNGNSSAGYLVPGGFAVTDLFIDAMTSDYSTSYALYNGTSMATPMTAGVAALVKSRFPSYNASQVKTAVVNTGDAVPGMSGQVASGRRINALNALTHPAIEGLSPSAVASGSGAMVLTVNGVNFEAGAVVRYNGVDRPTTYVSPTQVTAALSAADLTNVQLVAITVRNPGVGVTSSAASFAITGQPVSNGSSGGGGCFIATAAFGTSMAQDVRYLRAFRDQHLLDSTAGRWLVKQYYRYSPPVADYIRGHDGLKAVVRAGLTPLVAVSKWLVDDKVLEKQTADRP